MERTKYTPKRLLSLLLALIMLLGMFPTAALAAVTETKVNTASTAVEINRSSSVMGEYYHQSTSDSAVAQDGDIIFLPAVTVASYNAAKDASLTAGDTFDLALSFVVKNTGTSDYDMNSASEDYGVKVEQVDASGKSMGLANTSAGGDYLQKSVGTVTADGTKASNKTVSLQIQPQEDGTIYLKYSFMKREQAYTTVPLEAFATVFVKVTGTEGKFKITFDPGYFGAEGIPTSAMSTAKEFDASAITPTLDGYTFAGWEVTKTGGTLTATVTKGADGKWVVNGIDSDITLRAPWTKDGTTPATTHSVRFVQQNEFDGSSPVWPNDLTGAEGEKVKIPWTTPTAEGKTFLGWSTAENATAAEADYARGKEVTLGDKDIILYAVWADKTVKITYPISFTGGAVTKGPESVKPGASVTFKVSIGASYDESTLKVTANGVELGAVSKTTGQNTEGKDIITLTYKFNPTVDTEILVSAPS